MQQSELDRRFGYHPPLSPDVIKAHETVRDLCRDLSETLNKLLVDGREKAQAMTALDDVCIYSNASIARTQLQSAGRPDSPFA